MSGDPFTSTPKSEDEEVSIRISKAEFPTSLEMLALVTASFGPADQYVSGSITESEASASSTPKLSNQQKDSNSALSDELLALVTASIPREAW